MKWFTIFVGILCVRAQGQQSPVFKSETKLVVIEAVVTGKKGEYLRDLTSKDFRIWEDNKEQNIQSFTLESNSSNEEPRRMVLFFDNTGMSVADQASTRQAAARFVDANVAANELMAVVNFDGAFHVAQGFTDNAERLTEALQTLNLSSSSPNAPARFEGPRGHQPKGINPSSVNARDLIQSLGNLAQNLNAIPGRKIIVLFSSDTSFSALQSGDLVGLAEICNRSNVAVYPVLQSVVQDISENPIGPVGLIRPGVPGPNSPAIPDVQPDANIAVTIAKGTGGFVVPTSNDLVAELEKLGPEQSHYYVLGYTPHDSKQGACHTLRVKVDRRHANVRARSGYCAVKPQDLLAESTIEQDLEKRAAAPRTGSNTESATAEMQAPFFYVASNVAKVHVALEIPAKALKFKKQKGKLHAEMNILGIATAPNGNLAARFSDIIERSFESDQDVERFEARPLHYEKEFKIIPGRYNLTIVFDSGGTSFGKAEMPLAIDPYEAGRFTVSGVALSKQILPASKIGLEPSLMDEVTPLVASGMQLIPSGSNIFAPPEQAFCYFEVYIPRSEASAATIRLRVLDAKSGAIRWDGSSAKIDPPAAGALTIPLGSRLPIASLSPGAYQLEVTATNGADRTIKRMVDFEIK